MKAEFKQANFNQTFRIDIGCYTHRDRFIYNINISIPILFSVSIHDNGIIVHLLIWAFKCQYKTPLCSVPKKQDIELQYEHVLFVLEDKADMEATDFSVRRSQNSFTITKKATQPGHGT